jgi:CRISPR-associated endoribonuclease Cas6
MKVYQVNVKLRYHSSNTHIINAWSGSFSLKIVYDYFKRVGLDFEKKKSKPFFVEPLLFNGKYILTGFYQRRNEDFQPISCPFVMKDASTFDLNMIFLDYSVFQYFLEAFTKEEKLEEPSGIFISTSLSFREKELPKIEFGSSDNWAEFKIKIHYLTPTNFAFHGKNLTFPSPIRLIYGISKDLLRFEKQEFKEQIEKLILSAIDVDEVNIRKIYVDIGEGRKVPCFIGTASYYLSTKEGYIKALTNLLTWAETLGVGKSRSLGFGRIKIAIENI